MLSTSLLLLATAATVVTISFGSLAADAVADVALMCGESLFAEVTDAASVLPAVCVVVVSV
jgi:hypothetical protein